jgi:transposase
VVPAGARSPNRVFTGGERAPWQGAHNNLVERDLRGMVVGRKNHYGSKSLRGTQVAATFYTLVETASRHGVDPRAYLLAAARHALQNPGSALLPWQLAAQ